MNPFGPQGANVAFTQARNGNVVRYGARDTWVKDCSAAGLNDGTALDASFFNNLIGNLGYLVSKANIPNVMRGDMTLVYRAVQKVALSQAAAPNGWLIVVNGRLDGAVGRGVLPRLTALP